jgi:heme-degrading monooxygenase HmoA
MITVGMNYDVLPDKAEQFEAVFSKVLGLMKQMAGHGESRLYKDVFAPSSYLIVSEWHDRAAFDAFIASDRFRNVADWGKEQILASRPQHQIYESGQPA